MLGCWHGIKNPMQDVSPLHRHELGKSGWKKKLPYSGSKMPVIANGAMAKSEALFLSADTIHRYCTFHRTILRHLPGQWTLSLLLKEHAIYFTHSVLSLQTQSFRVNTNWRILGFNLSLCILSNDMTKCEVTLNCNGFTFVKRVVLFPPNSILLNNKEEQ